MRNLVDFNVTRFLFKANVHNNQLEKPRIGIP
jgi:hypothetical protein